LDFKVLVIGSGFMASKKLLELMNRGIARELQVSIQYMWQHVLVTGIKSVAVEGVFKEIAITEMKHAEEIAERLAYLGGNPTLKPDPIFVGSRAREKILGEEEHIDTFSRLLVGMVPLTDPEI
jgi:bacterioferritin